MFVFLLRMKKVSRRVLSLSKYEPLSSKLSFIPVVWAWTDFHLIGQKYDVLKNRYFLREGKP